MEGEGEEGVGVVVVTVAVIFSPFQIVSFHSSGPAAIHTSRS